MPRCAKYQYRTRTRGTRDPITAGIPVPVLNPTGGSSPLSLSSDPSIILPCFFYSKIPTLLNNVFRQEEHNVLQMWTLQLHNQDRNHGRDQHPKVTAPRSPRSLVGAL